MTIDGMTFEELHKALHEELCIRYVNETGLFDSVVRTFKDMDMLEESEPAVCVHCDESKEIWTVYITTLLDPYGTVFPVAHYDNYEAAQTHRDHITDKLATNNPLQITQAFVRDLIVHSAFECEDLP